jgi:hypothetical protein
MDKDAPKKINDRDTEISWLREVLGVRLDDLQDIINTLSADNYDRNAARDAAIRLRASLQMEQQVRERSMTGAVPQSLPSLASLSSLAASPRAIPLAAAAAWGNWRKGQQLATMPESSNDSTSETPSRTSPQSFLSGLMTPPSTNARLTPQPTTESRLATRAASASHRPLRQYTTPRRVSSSGEARRPLANIAPPATPEFLRTASYDRDAQSAHYSLDRYVEESDTSVDGKIAEGQEDGPFGPTLHE